MDRRERLNVFGHRVKAMADLQAIVITEVPDHLPEIQQLRLKLSQSRALVLALEVVLASLYERELPRSERTIDQNAHLNHIESLRLVGEALSIIQHAKERL